MNKQDLISKIKQLDGISQDERAYLINLVNTKKKYGLVWEDKPEEVEEQLRENLPVLKEVKEKAILAPAEVLEGEAPNHILIEGDNLHALTALTFTHEGKIDVIYIDPPYNTGNKDFKYNDTFVDKEDSYRHSKWLSFMDKRLRIAKRLLNESGVVFISIDDNEQAQLKLLCNEVFGEGNFKNLLAVRRRSKSLNLQFAANGLKSLNVGFEYILVYSKNPNKLFNPIKKEKADAAVNGTWNVFWSNADRPTMRYNLLGFTPKDGQWRWSEELAIKAVNNYKTYINEFSKEMPLEQYWENTGEQLKFIRRIDGGIGKNGGVQYWVPPSQTSLRTTNWTDIEVSEIHKEFEFNFNNPKSKTLIKELLRLSVFPINKSESQTILDFFAGSGTTLHATMALNAEDGGNRQCILVTNNENNICEEVTYERNKRVIQGYTNAKGVAVEGLKNNNLRYYKSEFVSRDTSLKNKRELTYLATELLCIKEDCYAAFPSKEKWFKAFTSKTAQFIVIYDEVRIEDSFEIIEALHAAKTNDNPVKVYVFSHGQYPYTEDFEEVLPLITLCALPDAIYKAYQNVLPKKKREVVPVLEEDAVGEEENLFNQDAH